MIGKMRLEVVRSSCTVRGSGVHIQVCYCNIRTYHNTHNYIYIYNMHILTVENCNAHLKGMLAG